MEDIKIRLMEQAKLKGICADGFREMRADDIASLIDYYVANPDWCLERDYPTLEFLKENFNNIEDKGVFVGKTFHGELLNDLQTYIFHNCKGTIKVGLNVDKAIIPMIYIANGCRLRIVGAGDWKPRRAKDIPLVPIYTFGRNDISAKDNAFVEFVHYKHELI